MSTSLRALAQPTVAGLLWGALAAAAPALQAPGPLPADARIGIEERLGAQVPLELGFLDHEGAPTRLGELFPGDGRPVLLTMNYSGCPQLCSAQLDGLVESLRAVERDPGRDFRVVTVSIDPEESPQTAAATRGRYLADYGRDGADWSFLTGDEASIRALADAVGFQYVFVPVTGEFAHVAALFLLTPAGRVARYLYGVRYEPRTLQLSLAETAAGELRSTTDKILLYCFQYDPAEGSYAPAVRNLTQVFGAVLVVALGGFLLKLFRQESRNRENPEA
ncbi:MAG: SCO family protein [Planctomycetes bacterium]|nr:SCO family protein [Planctomycetota bacterium]MBL7008627.1 SCO family protein [Planctomycetota bacterium]